MENQTNQTVDQQTQNREWAEEAFLTGHCHYLLQALALAMQRCQVWRLADTGEAFTLIDIFDFAKAYDEEHPLSEGQFYRTTVEGAIGICLGAEYLTHWLFTPMEPGEERDHLLQQVQLYMDQKQTEEESLPKAQPAKPIQKFCTKCGAKVVPGTKFCTKCGTRLTAS